MEVLEIEEKENITYPNFVVHDLISAAENDYITMRGVLILLGSNITWKKIVNDSAECLEKIMKAFLATKGGVRPESLKSCSHDLEKIRVACSNSDIFFNQENLKNFCKEFSGTKKGNEIFRYGFQQNTGAHGADLGKVLNLVDEFFLGTLIKIDDSFFVAATSNIAALICQTYSAEQIRQAMRPEQVKNLQIAICKENNFSDNFIKKINEFNLKIKKLNT